MDIAPIIEDMDDNVTLTVTTFTSPTANVYGEAEYTEFEVEISGYIHPAGRRTVERRGVQYVRGMQLLYTVTELPTEQPFELTHEGRTYQSVNTGDYVRIGGLNFYLLSLKDGNA